MSQRVIQSPGVEIRERDFSLIAPQNVGTNVFITGFTQRGPSDEVLKITSRDDLESIYGTPTNSAERYFYHGVRSLLESSANIYTFRLPYGGGTGAGYGTQYSALVYPILAVTPEVITTTLANNMSSVALSAATLTSVSNLSASVTNNLQLSSATYVIGAPVHYTLSDIEFNGILEGSNFTWSTAASAASSFTSVSSFGNAGLIILNQSQTTVNTQYEGFYIGVGDNSNINYATPYTGILGVQTISNSALYVGTSQYSYTTIPNSILQFSLSAAVNGPINSISQLMEGLNNYSIDGRDNDDLLNIGVFKLRKSLYATQAFKLDYILAGSVVGSIDYYRQTLNPTGGTAVSTFLENVDINDKNIVVLVNPNISNREKNTTFVNGLPNKKIRVFTNAFVNNVNTGSIATLSSVANALPLTTNNKYGVFWPQLAALSSTLGYADNLYALGAYSDTQLSTKTLGSIPDKLSRALNSVINDEIYDIDVVVEAGLGTIWTTMNSVTSLSSTVYDDTVVFPGISALRTSNDLVNTDATTIRANYTTIANLFENFCNLPSNTGGRGDCVFIADVLRHILISGKNTKILTNKTRSFQQDVYWAMRHQLELMNSSYATVYGNWALRYDEFLGDNVWCPFSSIAGAAFARNDAMQFPWSAPAGFTRGLLAGSVIDLAITPNQKQRDELYKSNINPVLFSPSQGFAIFGQKTLQRVPTAFDRLNVRRLFLTLERPTKKASLFYVFEPNDEYTRSRFIHTMTPMFEYAKNNGGLYDYLLICDERNNTGDTIDANELHFDAYIKPTRTAEYVILTFTATRTDAKFSELI